MNTDAKNALCTIAVFASIITAGVLTVHYVAYGFPSPAWICSALAVGIIACLPTI